MSLSSCGSERLSVVGLAAPAGLGLFDQSSKMSLLGAGQPCRIHPWPAGPLESRTGKLRSREVQSIFQGHTSSLGL